MADDKKRDERADIDCPKRGWPAKYGDGGVSCSNPRCENYGG